MTNIKSNFINSIKSFFKNKWRFLLFASIVLFSIMFFIFGLGYSTNVAKAENSGSKAIIEIVKEIQKANNELVFIGAIVVVFVFLNIMVGSHNRKKYFISNYIYMGGLLVFLSYGAIRMLQHSSYIIDLLKESFSDETLKLYWEILFIRNQRKDLTLDLIIDWFKMGYTFAALSLIGAVLVGILITVAVLILPKIKEREMYVKNRLDMVERGEIIVSEKVVNKVPTLDLTLDLSDENEVEIKPYNKTEKMRYLKNSLGYTLALLGLVFFLYALFMTITYDTFTSANDRPRVIPTLDVALDIVLSILITLIMFLSAEKVKIYEKKWSYVLLIIAVVNIFRIFNIPLKSLNSESLPVDVFIFNILIPMVISIVLTFTSAVISLSKTTRLNHFLKEIGEK